MSAAPVYAFDGECVVDATDGAVAMLLISGPDASTTERELGHAMAAAPQMLAALKQVKETFRKYPVARFIPELSAGIEAIDLIIAKAEGRS